MENSVFIFPSLIMFLSFIVFSGSTVASFSASPKPLQVFILGGQSNMAGRGGTAGPVWDENIPEECAADALIYRFNANYTWEIAYEPIHRDIGKKNKNVSCGVGPSMSFANTIKYAVGGAGIGLVPCAIGGSSIEQWARGEEYYDNMVQRANTAAGSGEIKGFLWYQGESDVGTIEAVNGYKQRMLTLIGNVREDLNLPLLPVIQVAIASGGYNASQTLVDELRAIQMGIDVPNVFCVDAFGLPLNGDHLHLTTDGQVTLGQMLGDAYINSLHAIHT